MQNLKIKKIKIPFGDKQIIGLRSGQKILLSGVIFTVRDQAHKRLAEAINKGKKLPIGLKDAVIYYCGPTPARSGEIIGSCGPTTSSRMDAFTPLLLKAGLAGMIGKGRRCQEVREMIKKYKAVYFLTYAGCGALLSGFVKKSELVAYASLGTEGVYKLEVEDFPVIVGIDSFGNDIFSVKS